MHFRGISILPFFQYSCPLALYTEISIHITSFVHCFVHWTVANKSPTIQQHCEQENYPRGSEPLLSWPGPFLSKILYEYPHHLVS